MCHSNSAHITIGLHIKLFLCEAVMVSNTGEAPSLDVIWTKEIYMLQT
jgi:hypothetical protein